LPYAAIGRRLMPRARKIPDNPRHGFVALRFEAGSRRSLPCEFSLIGAADDFSSEGAQSMNTRSRLCTALAAAAFLSTAGAFAQYGATPATPATPASPPSAATPATPATPKMTPEQAESEYRAAQTACNSQPADTRDQCLRDAKSKYDKALNKTGMAPKNEGGMSSGATSGQSGGTSSGQGSGTPK
jgi:hypothetical protein